jgi:uncharacterized protein YeaO (DUF488 family)
MIQLKRSYDGHSKGDGLRILVERLWPHQMTPEVSKILAGG